jgi:hypothetical protein
MVATVDAQPLFGSNLREHRAIANAYFMDNLVLPVGSVMPQSARHLRGDVQGQGPAQGDVQNLVTSTDGEQRLSLANDLVNQRQLELVSFRISSL